VGQTSVLIAVGVLPVPGVPNVTAIRDSDT